MSKMKFLSAVISMMYAPSDVWAETYSWGLPGLSRTDFESGSHNCAIDVARRDVSADKSTKRFLRGHEVLERENNMPTMAGQGMEDDVTRARRQVLLRNAYSTDRHIDSLQHELQEEMNKCLVRAGYVRFALSKEQARKLGRLEAGSERRKRYLYELGSDARIVTSQKDPD